MQYVLTVRFSADDDVQAENAQQMVRDTLPYVVDNLGTELAVDVDPVPCVLCGANLWPSGDTWIDSTGGDCCANSSEPIMDETGTVCVGYQQIGHRP